MTADLPTEIRDEFRAGFYPDRPAAWIEDVVTETQPSQADVAGHLDEIRAGKRDFSYPGHDRVVYRLLEQLVPRERLRVGADIGCATGCFPAMQLATGIERCTVFEVRETPATHLAVEVRIEDLSQATGLQPEFDLVTCLSTIEHVGLGRYGDPIDPWGDQKLARSLQQITRPGGFVLISLPVGAGCVVYNKHRVYTRFRWQALFEGFEIIEIRGDRSLPARVKHEAAKLVKGRVGSCRQPIFVLRPSRR